MNYWLSVIPSLGAIEGLSFFEDGQICQVAMNLSPLTFDYFARYLRRRYVLFFAMSVFCILVEVAGGGEEQDLSPFVPACILENMSPSQHKLEMARERELIDSGGKGDGNEKRK
jgi:hypothetical protein